MTPRCGARRPERASRDDLIDLVVDAHHVAEHEREQREQLEQQLRWFKKQLFGTKSERRIDLVPDPWQLHLGKGLATKVVPEEPIRVVRAYTRRQRAPREDDNESGLST